MNRTVMLALSLLVAVPACSKKKDESKGKQEGSATKGGDKGGGACPAFKVTVDGRPLVGLTFGQAVTMENAGYTTHQVTMFNHDGVPCEDAISGSHAIPEGELSVRAFHGAMPGVGIDAYTEIKGKITLDKATDKVGELMEICVREPNEFTPNAGVYSGKKVSIVGLFSGPWCGVSKQD